jgi:CRISPR type I-E-associated protein CasB/Cse2
MLQVSPEAATVEKAPRPSSGNSQRERELAQARDFIDLLEKLAENDRGRLAALKRNAGSPLPGRGVAWFYSTLRSDMANRYEEIFFLIATLYGFNRKNHIPGDFGASLRKVAALSGENGIGRRFHSLIDASFDDIIDPSNPEKKWQKGGGELAYRLRQLVKLCASKEVGIDWVQLLVDLCRWDHPGKITQKKWARSYFGQSTDVPASEEEAVA